MAEVKTVSEIIQEISPYYSKRAKEKSAGLIDSVAEAEHTLVYDSSSETLEPVYFFVLDLMNDFKLNPEKLIDNFASSPGSGHFSEIGQRATVMQQQGAKILGDINIVLRSVLNIIYDLKEFRIRLQYYDDLRSKVPSKSEGARLALKQVWMDKVDIQKGNSAIKPLAFQGGFATLIDAFLAVKDEKEVNKLDLNERIRRIVTPRIAEFNMWVEHSGKELKKRYELERNYLKSQVNSLKLYSRWAKPYLRAAAKLEQKDYGRNPDMVNIFNTLLLELTILGRNELKVKESALEGSLPNDFQKESFLRKLKRKYYSCILVDFKFRGIPQRIQTSQHYVFGGKVEITFKGYSLNEDEIFKLNEELDKSDLSDVIGLMEGSTGESLKQIQDEIDFFLDEKEEKEEKEKDSSNPFSALFGSYEKKREDKKPEKIKIKEVKKDNWIEKEHLRKLSAKNAIERAFSLFDIYKKVHGMASYT
ncbi:MAG: hypothetical protein AABW50_02810 [Nanoarchaeota archaeon]